VTSRGVDWQVATALVPDSITVALALISARIEPTHTASCSYVVIVFGMSEGAKAVIGKSLKESTQLFPLLTGNGSHFLGYHLGIAKKRSPETLYQ
jgi:hypothetical protein